MNNKRKEELLGMPFGTANGKLRKIILFSLVKELKKDICFRCNKIIKTIEELSIEHKEGWQLAEKPIIKFFDPENISFSHLKCNINASDNKNKGINNRRKINCPVGHNYNNVNTYITKSSSRQCKECIKLRIRRIRAKLTQLEEVNALEAF